MRISSLVATPSGSRVSSRLRAWQWSSLVAYPSGSRVSFFFEEKRILRRKTDRTAGPHKRLPQRDEKTRADVDTAKTQSRGHAHSGGRLGPLQGGPRARKRSSAVPAGRGGGAERAQARKSARSARHSGQRLLVRAWMITSHARHTKCAKRGAGHAHRSRGQGEQWSGCGRSDSKSSRQTGHDPGVGGVARATPASSGAIAARGRAT